MPIDRYVVAAQRADRAEALRLSDRLRAHRVHNVIEQRNLRHAVLVRRSDLDAAHKALHLMDKVRSELPDASRTTRIRSSLLESLGVTFAFIVLVVVVASLGVVAWNYGGGNWAGLGSVVGIALIALLFMSFSGTSGPVKTDRPAGRYHGPLTLERDNYVGRWIAARHQWGRTWRVRDWVMLAIVIAVVAGITLDLG